MGGACSISCQSRVPSLCLALHFPLCANNHPIGLSVLTSLEPRAHSAPPLSVWHACHPGTTRPEHLPSASAAPHPSIPSQGQRVVLHCCLAPLGQLLHQIQVLCPDNVQVHPPLPCPRPLAVSCDLCVQPPGPHNHQYHLPVPCSPGYSLGCCCDQSKIKTLACGLCPTWLALHARGPLVTCGSSQPC